MTATPPQPPPSATILSLPNQAAVRRARTARRLRGVALLLALLAVLTPVLAVLGFRKGRLDFPTAHDLLVGRVTPALAVAALALALLALLVGLFGRPRKGTGAALLAGVVAALVLGGVGVLLAQERAAIAGAPPVHEVSTDWRDPPTFSARLLALRGPGANPIESVPAVPEGPGAAAGFLGRPVAEVNARTCPAAAPAVLLLTPAQAYMRAKAAVLAERMRLVTDDPAALRLEATARRGLWAIADDLVVRIRPEGAGARVDLRSAARQGLNDGGANCARLTRLRAALS